MGPLSLVFQVADDSLQGILHVQEPLAHCLELGALADQIFRHILHLICYGMTLPFGVGRVHVWQMVGNLHRDIVSHGAGHALGFGFGLWLAMDCL